MNEKEFQLMISAAKQYYQLGISQEEIARKAYVSKSTVSRLIRKAVDLGSVSYTHLSFASARLPPQCFPLLFGWGSGRNGTV